MAWFSNKQSILALSSCETEHVAASMGVFQAQWLDELMTEMGSKNEGSMRMLIDNKSAIDLSKHPIAHARSKHIERRFRF